MRTVLLIVSVVMLGATLARAADPVKVSRETMTFNVIMAGAGPRGAKEPGEGYYPIRGSHHPTQQQVEVIKLNNGLIEAWVVPAWGARLLRVIDLETKADYFGWGDEIQGHLGWGTVGLEPSFPFFEHGVHLDQPAGHRIVTNDDGSVTVAMDMRFTQHQRKADSTRYGRYSDEALSVMITVYPNSTLVRWRQRKDNPNPLPRSDRMWNCAVYPAERPLIDGTDRQGNPAKVTDQPAMKQLTEFIYPARWVVDHGPKVVHTSPHFSALDNWNVSHFAIDPLGFSGGYYPKESRNRIRIHDPRPDHGPGMKLYTTFGVGKFELWGGQGYVFEHPGKLLPGYVPTEFVNDFYNVDGIGKVTFANEALAVSVDGTKFEMVSPTKRAVQVRGADGSMIDAEVGPRTPFRGTFDGQRLTVIQDGRPILDQTFPLDLPKPEKDTPIPPEMQERFESLLRYEPSRPELEQVMNNEGMATSADAIKAASAMKDAPIEQRLSISRTLHRFAKLDQALQLIEGIDSPDADYLRGLIAWEQGGPVDFKSADWQADYHRALLAIAAGKKSDAIAHLDRYLKHAPSAWYPRLARAYVMSDIEGARQLAREHPASPEAQAVLKLLGDASAEAGLASLTTNNPHADEQVKSFVEQITKGTWKPLPRYAPLSQ